MSSWHPFLFLKFFKNLLTFWVHYNIINVYSISEVIENPKSEQIKIRATKKDKELLEKCCEKLDQTQYEVIMTGIKRVYAEVEKK